MPAAKKGKSFGRKNLSKSQRAGLQFPVGRMERQMRDCGYSLRYSTDASVYLASVIEYLMAEILELSGNECRNNRKRRIQDRHIFIAFDNDDELKDMIKDDSYKEIKTADLDRSRPKKRIKKAKIHKKTKNGDAFDACHEEYLGQFGTMRRGK